MRRLTWAAPAAATTAVVGIAAYRKMRAKSPDRPRTHAVTVFRPVDYVTANLPEQIRALSGDADVRIEAAPGDRGTWILVRSIDGRADDGDIRRALREGRSMLEVGEVLQPGVATTKPTPLNKPLRAVTERGREGGLL